MTASKRHDLSQVCCKLCDSLKHHAHQAPEKAGKIESGLPGRAKKTNKKEEERDMTFRASMGTRVAG